MNFWQIEAARAQQVAMLGDGAGCLARRRARLLASCSYPVRHLLAISSMAPSDYRTRNA